MDYKEIVRMALDEYTDEMNRALDGLTAEERRHQPTPDSNHIDFLEWHIARVEDGWINGFARGTQVVWESAEWYKQLGFPAEGGGYGYGAEQVRDLPEFDLDLMHQYANAVRQTTHAYLESSTPQELDRAPGIRPERPNYTIGNALSHLLVEESQHVGQIAYIRGMLRGINQ